MSFIEGIIARKRKHLTVKYLSPYSPFLNPIEKCFSKWKSLVLAAKCVDQEDLLRTIDKCFNQITPDDCGNIFIHTLRKVEEALLGLPMYE